MDRGWEREHFPMWRSTLQGAFMDAPIHAGMLRSWAPELPPLLQVQQRCWDLERMLQGYVLPIPQPASSGGGQPPPLRPGRLSPLPPVPPVTSPRSGQQP